MKKLPGTHKFLSLMVCNACGFKVPWHPIGKLTMVDHLFEQHPDMVAAERAEVPTS